MTKRSLLNIEGSFGSTNTDIADLRKQIDAGERLTENKHNKNYYLNKLPALGENASLGELIGEIKECVAEDFGFIIELTENGQVDDSFSAYGHKINPGQSSLLSSVGGADIVCIVALNHLGDDGPRIIMDFGSYIPDTMGELKTNEFIMFPSWVPYGWSENFAGDSLYTVELFFNILGTKDEEEQFIARINAEGPPEPLEVPPTSEVEVVSDGDTSETEVVPDED